MNRFVRLFTASVALAAATVFAALVDTASAQTTDSAKAPPRRAHHAMVYDEANHRIVLTGGSTPLDGGRSFAFFNDVWSFDGAGWKSLGTSGTQRSGQKLAYDAAHLRETLGDTWEFDGRAWRKIAIAGPEPRQAHVMVYDEKRGRTVVFGGFSGSPGGPPPQFFGDTWEYDGISWTRVSTTGPGPRIAAGAAYDSKRGLVIVFGGGTGAETSRETWAWDGATWRKLADTGPGKRNMGYMAYDRDRDRIVLFGGRERYPDGELNDTWEWDGSAWKQVR